MKPEAFPSEALRRQLAAIGVPPERHALRELLRLLPAEPDGRPFDEMSADTVAEVLIYLVGKNVVSVPPLAPAKLDLEWGAHRCESYASWHELLELAVPYFSQGLARNERCLWVAPPALASRIARQQDDRLRDLRNAGDQLEILDGADWHANALQREEARALAQGYNGLRISGDLVHVATGRRTKALCTHRAPTFTG